MSSRAFASLIVVAAAGALLFAARPAAGQDEGNRSRRDHLTALPAQVIQPPRTPFGDPDLQGTWGPAGRKGGFTHSIEEGFDPTTTLFHGWAVEDNQVNLLVDPMRGKIPYQPWTEARRTQALVGHFIPTRRTDQEGWLRCLPAGTPRAQVGGTTIRQLPGHVLFLDAVRGTRIIPLDGSPHPDANLKLWRGDSRGRWEGSTLVIETTNNNDLTEFDAHGTFHSDALRVIERLTMIDMETIYYEATIEDPNVFTQAWKLATTWDRNKNPQKPWENACYGEANEFNIERMVEAGRRGWDAGIRGVHTHDPTDITKSYVPAVPLSDEEKALAPPTDTEGLPPAYDPDVPPPLKAPDPNKDYQAP